MSSRALRVHLAIFIAIAGFLSGCISDSSAPPCAEVQGGCNGHSGRTNGTEGEPHVTRFMDDSGAKLASTATIGGIRVDVLAHNVSFPLSIQATFIGKNGEIEPLLFGGELDLRHNLEGSGVVEADGGVEKVSVDGLEDVIPGAGGTFQVPTAGGWLILAWANLPEGLLVSTIGDSEAAWEDAIDLESLFVRGTALEGGFSFYSPVLQGGASDIYEESESPFLFHVRMLKPTNLGAGQLSLNAARGSWATTFSEGSNTSCIDCYVLHRYVGAAMGPWTMSSEVLGRSGNQQAYAMAIRLPSSFAGSTLNPWQEIPDCLASFNGC